MEACWFITCAEIIPKEASFPSAIPFENVAGNGEVFTSEFQYRKHIIKSRTYSFGNNGFPK